MTLLIDGYNLIHAVNILGRGVGPGGLERARRALLDFLVASFAEAQLPQITVVFDAENAPPGLPRQYGYKGIHVRFSAGYDDADELIEELIKLDSAPRKLVVVSSDHRLHRAARRRRAQAIDSDRWYDQVLQRRKLETSPKQTEPSKPLPPELMVSKEEIDVWSHELAGESLDSIFPPGYFDDIDEEEGEPS